MSKNIKTITKILITILMVIGILLILPKDSIGFSINRNTQVNGNVTEHVRNSETLKDGDVFSKSRVYYTGKDNNFKTLQELIDGASLKVVEGQVFQNNFVFCIEHGQHLNAGSQSESTYDIDYKITFDGSEVKRYDRAGNLKETYKTASDINCFKKVTYILSQIDGPQCKFNGFRTLFKSYDANNYKWSDTNYYYGEWKNGQFKPDWHFALRDDPIQNALWTLVHNNSSITDKILTTGSSDAGSSSSIYTAANGALNGKFELVLYVMKHTNQQSLIIVEKAEFTETVDVTLNFNKVKMDGTTKLNGAKISVKGVRNVASITNNLATTASNSGNLGSITVNPSDLSDNTFEIEITETKIPDGYIGINKTTLTVTYNTSTGAVTKVESNNKTYVPDRTNNTILIKNRPVVSLKFYKRDFGTTKLGGAEIEVTGYENTVSKFMGRNNNKTLINTDSKTLGTFETLTIYPSHENSYAKAKDGKATLKLKVKEIKAPTGYLKMPEEVILTVTYDIYTGDVISITDENAQNKDSVYINPTSDGKNVIVRNQPVLSSLKIIKTDSLTGNKLAGAQFKIELTGVSALANYQVPTTGETQKSPTVVYVTTNNAGEINLSGLVLDTNKTEIKVRITEKGVPYTYEKPHSDGYYYKVDETPIEFTITYNNGSWSVTGGSTTGISISSDNAEISRSNVSINIANQPYITLSGKVWQDGQTGNKVVTGPNGEIDNGENGLAGVYVRLYNLKTGDRDYRVKDDDEPTYTDANGNYSFVDVPKTNEGYKVIFNYDGINYQETNSLGTGGTASKTEEIIKDTGKYEYYRDDETTTREQFNNKFKTVSKDKITSRDGKTNTPIQYNYESDKGYIVDIGMDGTNPASDDQNGIDKKDFQMRARTAICYNSTDNLNCGLVKKVFDLNAGTDVKEATLTINDKETTYNYQQIMNGALDDVLQNNSADKGIKYNLYLYTSDYNYRIEDYRVGNETILNNINPGEFKEIDETKELEAIVKYAVTLNNQTTYNAKVDEFVYYYDLIYTPEFKKDDVIDGYKVMSIENNKITFASAEENDLSKENDYRKEIELTFKVNKDANGIILKDNISNVAEITKYTTEQGGLIDADSAPNNANVAFENGTPKASLDEDDTDEAPGLTISLREDYSRTVSGTVTDDNDGDGDLEASEGKINGVVVQLIEIKEADLDGNGINEKYEYIWQETKTGSNIVLCTPRNGYSDKIYTYENSVTESDKGKFEFKHFIPGNYIVRYIYGDVPRCYSEPVSDVETTKQYNGQDYKSTIDAKYNSEWYNGAGYTKGQSVARDNEARRLEVMAHSAMVNEEMYKKEQDKINQKIAEGWTKETAEAWKYHFTWMAAETSKLNVTIDNKEATTTEATQATNSTRVSYNDIKDNKVVSFTDMDFGLTLRPKTELVLEKHITGLKVTPNGVGVQPIVDATADIEKIIKDKKVDVTGVTTGLATIISDRGNRGFWQLATDIEELAQGAELEVEYTYVIRNIGDVDYLSAFLVNEYEKGNITEYINLLKNKAQEVKGATKGNTHSYGSYLGEFYYTGKEADTDKLVTTRVETLEEALNNKLVFETEGNEDFKRTNESVVDKNVYNVDGVIATQGINTIVQSSKSSKFLTTDSTDYSKTIVLRTLLTSSNNGEIGANLPSYIAEITSYSNAAGRIDMETKVANLSYVHSDDTEITMSTHNEEDEFWAESIIITKPTGEDKVAPIQIVIIAISSLAVIGAGIVLIKKFVLKK